MNSTQETTRRPGNLASSAPPVALQAPQPDAAQGAMVTQVIISTAHSIIIIIRVRPMNEPRRRRRSKMSTTTSTSTSAAQEESTSSFKMTPAREAAELLGELFPEIPPPTQKRQWPVMAPTVDANNSRAPVRDAPDRSNPSLTYWLGLTAALIFAAIVIGVVMTRRAPVKQVMHDQRRATPRIPEKETEAYLPPMQYSARRFSVVGVNDHKGYLPTGKRKNEDEDDYEN